MTYVALGGGGGGTTTARFKEGKKALKQSFSRKRSSEGMSVSSC